MKKRLYVSAMALGLAVGSVGIASAMTGDTTAPAPASEEANEVAEPSYTGSLQAPVEEETLSESDEATQLEGLATVTPDEAASAASAVVAGTVGDVELDNENGSVVYSVEITNDAGVETDVKIDAGDGTVLDQQADDESEEADEAEDADEADDDDVQDENENDVDEGHED